MFRRKQKKCGHCNGTGRTIYREGGHEVTDRNGRPSGSTWSQGEVTCGQCGGTGTV